MVRAAFAIDEWLCDEIMPLQSQRLQWRLSTLVNITTAELLSPCLLGVTA